MSTPSFLLSELLMALGTTRMAIESKKRQLVDLPSYTSASVFALFDTEGKGHISLANLYDYLKLRYIFPTEAELFSLFKQMDTLKMGIIQPSQLSDFLTPQGRTAINSKSHFGHLDSATTAVFNQYLENYRNIEMAKSKLRQQAEPSSYFRLLDSNRNGKVSTLEVRSFMLAHGCLDQDIISNTVIQIQNHLGCNFDETTLVGYLVLKEEQSRSESRLLTKSRESSQHRSVQQQATETCPVTAKTMNEFDYVLQVRSQENEERRHYLKEQEKLRTKIMEEVLARKRSYLNVRTPDEHGQRVDTQEDYLEQYEQKQRSSDYNRPTAVVKLPNEDRPLRTAISPNIVRQSYKTMDKEDVMKRAASEAQLKIEQIQRNAKIRAEERRKVEAVREPVSDSSFQELLLKKNCELEMEKQRRLTLEKELSRSKDQITLLKNHLQSINKLQYRELDMVRPTKLSQSISGQLYQGEVYRPKQQAALRQCNREVGSIYEVNRAAINRSETGGKHMEFSENKYELEQALRRSRVEREFAKFKLEKELARSRVAWR